MADSCKTCRFWNTVSERCQKNAPTIVVKPDGKVWSGWPMTKLSDWCGQYEKSGQYV